MDGLSTKRVTELANHPNRNKGPKGPDLIASALATIALPGMSSRQAAAQMVESINADLGTAYATNDLGKWRRADRPIPQPVQDWLLRVCVAHAITLCGGTPPADDAALDQLAAMLCPPRRP